MLIRIAALAMLAIGSLAAVGTLHIATKAMVAQWLLERAWSTTLATGRPTRPWPWADVHPVARLSVPTLDVERMVLDDASGEALAFGPGRVAGDADDPRSTLVIGGHRDTHLAFLEGLAAGTLLRLQLADGRSRVFRIGRGRIVDSRHDTIAIAPHGRALVLLTCWPFDAPFAGGPLRYVVTARPAGLASSLGAQPNGASMAGSA